MRKRILVAAGVLVVAAVAVFFLTARGRKTAWKPGQIVWQRYTGPCVCFNPAVYGDTVYFGSEPVSRIYLLSRILPSRCYLQAVDAATGKRRWRMKVDDRVTVAPLVADGTVYFGTWGHQFFAVEEKTGKEKWNFSAENPFQASPVLTADGKSIALFWRDGYVYILDRETGGVRWKYAAGGDVGSGLATRGETVFGGNSFGSVFAVDLQTGRTKWSHTAGKAISNSTPAIAGDMLYIGSLDGNLYALDVATGREKWRFPAGAAIETSPRLSDGTVFFGCNNGTLYAVDALLGSKKWAFKARGSIRSSPALADGVVYFGCEGGDFYAVDSATGRELWSLNVGRAINTDPVIAGDVVCFGDFAQNMYAVCIKASERGK